MKKSMKIMIAAGATIVVGIGGYLVYRKLSGGNEAARVFIKEVDKNKSMDIRKGRAIPISVKSKRVASINRKR